jgi:hypothetical protein
VAEEKAKRQSGKTRQETTLEYSGFGSTILSGFSTDAIGSSILDSPTLFSDM